MPRREFQFTEGTSSKFWAIELNGSSFTVHYGRIGTSGQAQQKSFASDAVAQREHDKLIAEKTKKGYTEVSTNGAAAMPSPTVRTSAPKAMAKPAEPSPAEAVAPIPVNAPEPTPVQQSTAAVGPLERSIELSAEDRCVVTWIDQPTLAKPASPAFDLNDCLERLKAVGKEESIWALEWRRARIPKFPSPPEAQFWLTAIPLRNEKGLDNAAKQLAKQNFDGAISMEDAANGYFCFWRSTEFLGGCLAAIMQINDWALLQSKQRYQSNAEFADLFREYVLPYLTAEQRLDLKKNIAGKIVPTPPVGPYDSFPTSYYLGALLGCQNEIAAALKAIPDGYYSQPAQAFASHYHRTQWLVFGLGDSPTVGSEFRRLGLPLKNKEEAIAWVALTGYEGLDVLSEQICKLKSKDDAGKLASVLSLVTAPEAAVPALQLVLNSKAPQVGQEWLSSRPLHAAVGLAPAAMGQGKTADAAREYLHTMRRGGLTAILTAAKDHLSVEEAAWLQREIIECEEETLPEISHDELPEPLRSAFAGLKPARPIGWIAPGSLPPIKVFGKKLGIADVNQILDALKTNPIGTEPAKLSPLIPALKNAAEPNFLDRFAWRLFELWLSNGAPSKEKWALGAIGHLGGDSSVLKLTPLIRDWPGESQHQRAVFGLECLRAVGTDTALMALNGIAQKLKFKGLKEKAQKLMSEIAESRGLTAQQLADRIVPDCGLDERGSRVFDFGPRQFRFVLGPEMKPLVRDSAGKVRPDLPAPNSSDERDKAEAAVAEWKLLKKTLREVLKIQAERLEDAMITGRRWTPEEFSQLLMKHPLMINLVRQLVFGIYDDAGRLTSSFRVTEDQTIADHQDEGTELPSSGNVGVVHPAHLDEGVKGAWGQLLSDYEIIPPFQQLGRAICHPHPDDVNATEITRYRGPKVPGITMYGMLERSHWLRDTPADGGGFVQHSKFFPSANLTAFIQYDGMSIGYYDEPQELKSVYFVPGHVEPEWWGDHKNRLKIKDVDPVVISEVLRLANAIVSKAE